MKLSNKQEQQINFFKKELLEKNKVINLFSRKNPEKQINFLFDQAFLSGKVLSSVLSENSGPVLDIGSGNGFPGLFMGILFPETFFYLCERNRKKAEFLKYVLTESSCKNVKVLCKEAEEMEKQFSLILSQAALPTKQMLKLLTKLLSSEGEAFLWKGACWKKEWPEKTEFIPELFKSYEIENLKYVLLRVRKTKRSA